MAKYFILYPPREYTDSPHDLGVFGDGHLVAVPFDTLDEAVAEAQRVAADRLGTLFCIARLEGYVVTELTTRFRQWEGPKGPSG